MRTLQFALFFLVLLVGGCLAFYGGIGALFLLGNRDSGFHPLGFLFVAIASVGVATIGLGIWLLMKREGRSSRGGPRP